MSDNALAADVGEPADESADFRRRAEESRASAAGHRARAHELRASVTTGRHRADAGEDGAGVSGAASEAYLHAGAEELRAEIADLRAGALNERALNCEERARARVVQDGRESRAALERAEAALRRAELHDQQAERLSARFGSWPPEADEQA